MMLDVCGQSNWAKHQANLQVRSRLAFWLLNRTGPLEGLSDLVLADSEVQERSDVHALAVSPSSHDSKMRECRFISLTLRSKHK
jgi:hypothetical protein